MWNSVTLAFSECPSYFTFLTVLTLLLLLTELLNIADYDFLKKCSSTSKIRVLKKTPNKTQEEPVSNVKEIILMRKRGAREWKKGLIPRALLPWVFGINSSMWEKDCVKFWITSLHSILQKIAWQHSQPVPSTTQGAVRTQQTLPDLITGHFQQISNREIALMFYRKLLNLQA